METRSQELVRYVRLVPSDSELLAKAGSLLRPHFERVADEFYDRVREHEAAHAVLTGEDQIIRLQRSLVAWLERLFAGTYDDAYFAKTAQVGRTHVRVGLPQRFMFGAMALVRSSLGKLIDEHVTNDAAATRDALGRLLDVELAVMLDAYDEHLAARVARAATLQAEGERRRGTPLEEHAAIAIEVAPLLVVALDDAGAITLFNRAAERLTGYAQDEVIGLDFASIFLRDGARFPDGANERIELPLTTRAGMIRTIRWDIARAVPHVLAFGSDITDDARARERLEQDQRLAAVGTLAAGLAHEIRNPLNGARLHADYLERLVGSMPDAVDAVRIVKSEIQRLARLVDEFMDFAQARPLARKPIDTRALVEKVLARIPARADLPESPLVFVGDPGALEKMLDRLLANAHEAGAKVITVRARREPHHVRFEVEDDGPGFVAGTPIFDAFFTTKATGTGLGLAFVHRVVLDHGGTVDAESRPGCTRFRIRLPLESEGKGETR